MYVWLIQRLSMSKLNLTKTTQAHTPLCYRYPDLSPPCHHTSIFLIYSLSYSVPQAQILQTERFVSFYYSIESLWLTKSSSTTHTNVHKLYTKIPYGGNITRSDRNCVSSSRFGQKGLVYLCISNAKFFLHYSRTYTIAPSYELISLNAKRIFPFVVTTFSVHSIMCRYSVTVSV